MKIDEGNHNYLDIFGDTYESAQIIIPILFGIIGRPRSVVDLGGGIGAWCKVFKEKGGSRVTCIDDQSIRRSELKISSEEFVPWNLSRSLPAPVGCELAICLEVAEHLPKRLSKDIVSFLVNSAPLVLFSAAIPGQTGVGHVNEQPPKYWEDLFAEFKYLKFDLIRPKIIHNQLVPFWYRQNIVLYANKQWEERLKAVGTEFQNIPRDFELVHERVLQSYRMRHGIRNWIKEFPSALKTSLEAHLRRACANRCN
jgi:hypothetical protein